MLGSSPRTSGGPIGLAEASPERQCCCWGRAEAPQDLPSLPGGDLCGNRPGLPPGATGNSRLGPSCHRPGSWDGVCRAVAPGGTGWGLAPGAELPEAL